MTQSEFIEQVATAAGTTQAEVGRVLEAMVATVSGALTNGGDVRLSGLGVFDVGARAARELVLARTTVEKHVCPPLA